MPASNLRNGPKTDGARRLGPCEYLLINPCLVADGEAVQGLAVELPLGQRPIHQGNESGVMRRLSQMNQHVGQDVFDALQRLFHQFEV